MRLSFLLLLLIWFNTVLAQTSSLPYINYTIKNGLTHNAINCMMQDSRGYMWLGTTEGLNRFDGKHFRNFFTDDENTGLLKGNTISALLEYKPGLILLGTNKGLSVYNFYTNSFQNEKINTPAAQKFSKQGYYSFFKNSENKIFINYNGKIDVYNDSLTFLYCLTDKPWAVNLRGISVYRSWQEDDEGRLWLPDDNYGIQIINEKKQEVFNYKNNPNHFPFMGNGPVRSLFYDSKSKTVWYSIWGNGLEKYNLLTKTYAIQSFNLPRGNEGRTINAIIKDEDGSFICGGGQEIYRLNPATLEFTVLTKQTEGTAPITLCRCIMKSEGNTWIGTETMGLFCLPASAHYVKQIPMSFPVSDYTNICTSIEHSAEGFIYCAYGFDGLMEINTKDYSIRQYKIPNTLKAKRVIKIAEDKKHRLLVGTDDGVYLFDKNKKQFSQPGWLLFGPKGTEIFSMLAASDGKLWVSYYNPKALGYYDEALNQFTYYENYVDNGVPFFDNAFRLGKIKEDEDGNIWMAAYQNGGLLYHEKKTGTWKTFPSSEKNKKIINSISINSIYAERNDIIWIASTMGLIKYNYQTDSIEQFSRRTGLLSNNITSITKNDDGLILANELGLNHYNTLSGNFSSLKLSDETINWSFSNSQLYDSVLNSAVFGLNDRIVIINNPIWKLNTAQHGVYIDDIIVNSENLNKETTTGTLQLNYWQQNVFISFSQPFYNGSNENYYAYKLEGVDKKWNENNNAASASYSNLSPGNYTLLVKSKNQFNEWGEINSSLHILITPAFWQRMWFKIFILLAATGLIYWVIKRRIKSIRHEAELKQQITETEMMALRAQMN